MAKKNEAEGAETADVKTDWPTAGSNAEETKAAAEAKPADENYMYVGSLASSYNIAGQEITVSPGQMITSPTGDKTVQRLIKQGLLIPYKVKNKKH